MNRSRRASGVPCPECGCVKTYVCDLANFRVAVLRCAKCCHEFVHLLF